MVSSEEVASALHNTAFRRAGESFDRRSLIEHAKSIGPRMRLLHWQRLEKLEQLPNFANLEAEDAVTGVKRFGAPAVEIFMVSHRWLRPSLDPASAHPDDERATKARALTEFSHWRRAWVSKHHGFLPEIFYWIDYCCFDQSTAADGIKMLPLWIASCERLLCFETADYHDRAWCRLELLLSYTFGFADHQTVIGPGFRADALGEGTGDVHVLDRPTTGRLTVVGDAARIEQLEQFAASSRRPRLIESLVSGLNRLSSA